MKRYLSVLTALVVVGLSGAAHAQQTIVADSRSVDWRSAGVAGGLPPRTAICATLNPGATAAQINSAIASCPAGQTVKLNAGTYNVGGIDFTGKSNVTLRGAGADQTFLVFNNDVGCHGAIADVCMTSSDLNWKGGMSNVVNWTGGYAKGTSTITLASVPNLKVGFPIILDQLDDSSDNGAIVVTDSQGTSSPSGTGSPGPFSLEGNGGGAQRSGRQQMQIVTVTGCGGVTTPGAACSGTNVAVTISPGLYMPNWRGSQSPSAWWATSPVMMDGLENMSLDHSGTGVAGIEMFNCLNCWVSGVRSVNTGRAHVQVYLSARATIRDSYFFLTQNSVSQSYGFECYASSDSLVENNIFQAIAAPEMINGACSGTVVAYNFSINNYYTNANHYNASANNIHTAGIDNVLFEGNYGNAIYGDLFHGTHHFLTYFRNRWTGPQPACWVSGSPYASATFGSCTSNTSAIVLQSFSRFVNLVGNVLGTAGVNNNYESFPGASTSGPVYDLSSGNSNSSVTVPSDLNTRNTLMRWGNYDTATASIRWVNAEVPSALGGAQAAYSNPVPPSQTLPPSFYLLGRPGWWPAGKVWPPIGPDVTGGNLPNLGGHAYTIPAQDCFASMGGPADGTGPVRTFNPANCYASGGGGTAPAAPTNLRIVP